MKALVWLAICSCASRSDVPRAASAPAYVAINAGDAAPDDGFFLSVPAARTKLLQDRMHDLDLGEQLAESEMHRQAAESRAAKSEFCATYCLEIGAGSVIIVELIAVGFYAALHR